MKRKGFTLIELLIVVAIIAILAAIAVPNFLEAQTRSKVARTKADMRTIATAFEAYTVDYNDVPHRGDQYGGQYDQGFLDFQPFNPYIPGFFWFFPPHMLTTPVAYLASIPYDPFNSSCFRNFSKMYGAGIFNAGRASVWVQIAPLKGTAFPELLPQLGLGHQPWAESAGGEFRWSLQSTGPSLWFECNAFWLPFYDPTNGTVSTGDIFYFNRGGLRGGGGS